VYTLTALILGDVYMERLPTLSLHDLTERELLILRQEVEDRKKSTASTWLLWLFLGEFGAHRFYMGKIGTAIAMLLTLGGLLIWWLVDAFLIAGMLRSDQHRVQRQVLEEIAAMRSAHKSEKDGKKVNQR
jgi:TM2 domain-containing membrane protein YozV